MSLYLCRQEHVTSPYYIEELGIHIYSSQELCYVIYHYPFLAMEDFVNERLTAFLRRELRMPFLAERLEKWMKSRGTSDELLFLILHDCGFYTQAEQAAYRQELSSIRKLPKEEYDKRRADYFYSLSMFGKAIAMYEKILEDSGEKKLPGELKGKIWNNIAACYGKLFCYQKAMHAYDCAWNEYPDPELVKRMYFLKVMEPELFIKEKYTDMMTEENKASWDAAAQAAMDEARSGASVIKIDQLFEKDPPSRIAGAGEVLNRWKVAYRKML